MDKKDIARRLRQTRADMIGTDDEDHYWHCQDAASHIELLEAAYKSSGSALAVIDGGFKNAVAEIARLRLTDSEREAMEFFSTMVWPKASQQCRARSATLRGLLARLSGTGDCPAADNAAKQDTTGVRNGTPGKCTAPTGCIETGGM